MKNNYTHIIMVLDRSGSMQSIKNDVIGGFNQFLEDQKKVDGQASLTLAQFDDEYEVLEDFTDLQKVKLLDQNTYVPRSTRYWYSFLPYSPVVWVSLSMYPNNFSSAYSKKRWFLWI